MNSADHDQAAQKFETFATDRKIAKLDFTISIQYLSACILLLAHRGY
jgi:hypothetical protein